MATVFARERRDTRTALGMAALWLRVIADTCVNAAGIQVRPPLDQKKESHTHRRRETLTLNRTLPPDSSHPLSIRL